MDDLHKSFPVFCSMDNYEIADNFSLLGKLMDIHNENSFKAKSYSVAAFNIEKLPVQLNELPKEKLFSLPGIRGCNRQEDNRAS